MRQFFIRPTIFAKFFAAFYFLEGKPTINNLTERERRTFHTRVHKKVSRLSNQIIRQFESAIKRWRESNSRPCDKWNAAGTNWIVFSYKSGWFSLTARTPFTALAFFFRKVSVFFYIFYFQGEPVPRERTRGKWKKFTFAPPPMCDVSDDSTSLYVFFR